MHAAEKDQEFLGLLGAEAKKSPDLVRGEWRDKGAVAGGKTLGSSNPKLPVMRVTVTEAHCLARWLGGFLPTDQQWDKAAGLFEEKRGEGPYRGVWAQLTPAEQKQIAVNRYAEGPMAINQPTLDVSAFGCRHMSGNGREWTRNANRDRRVALPSPITADTVLLRGRNYQESVPPLTFKDLQGTPESSYYIPNRQEFEPHPDIGFRVVLEPQ
jgi:formylglycine-generating enzyme required for sulfatase activity